MVSERLALGELRAAAGAVQAVLLAFLHAAVAAEEVLFAELLDQVAVCLLYTSDAADE